MTGNDGARIVVGIDGSGHSARALRWAIEEASCRDAALHLVHAWNAPYIGVDIVGFTAKASVFEAAETAAGAVLDDAAAAAAGLVGNIQRTLVSGPPTAALLEAAKGADLLVVGSRGRGGFSGLLLGSVSQQCVHHATCPVVVVPCASVGDRQEDRDG